MKSLVSFILITFCVALQGQAPKEKWGKVTREELTMTSCSLDPSAAAAILDNYGHYYFNRHYYFSNQELRTIYHYQVRLKIFSDLGKKYATVSIPFKGYDEYENVVEISGYTYNLEGDKVVKTKFKVKTATWTRNERGLWNCTFTLPNVKAGSVIEYTYKIASLDFARLRDWLFQCDIPVLHSDIVLSTPEFFQFAFFSNVPSYNLEVKKWDQNQYIQFYNLNIYTNGSNLQLTARNVPAFQKEVMMPDSSRLIWKGEFLLAQAITRPPEFSHINDYYLMPYLKPLLVTTTENYYAPLERIYLYNSFIGGYKIIEGMDWDSFAKKLSKKEEFGRNILKAFENKWLIDSFRKVETGKKRMIAIYDYVKQNMKWNGQYRIFTSNSLEKIFESKTGYSSDINLLMINLLNRSGIQAKPVLISTRSYGNVYKEMAFFRKFNHVIVSVEIDGNRYLLDATNPLRPFNLLDMDDLNGEGLLVNNLDYQWIPLENSRKSEIRQSEEYHIFSEGNFNTNVTDTFSGYHALLKRQELLNINSVKANVLNLLNNGLPLIIKSSLEGRLSEVTTDSMAFAPLSINSLVDNPFTSDKRIHPVDMKFERTITREIIINAPEGYRLKSYPGSRQFTMEGEFVDFNLTALADQDTLKLNYKMEVNNAFIPNQFYPDLKLFLEALKKVEQERVVFVKK